MAFIYVTNNSIVGYKPLGYNLKMHEHFSRVLCQTLVGYGYVIDATKTVLDMPSSVSNKKKKKYGAIIMSVLLCPCFF